MKSSAVDSFYNVGTGKKTSLKSLAELLVQITNCKKPIKYIKQNEKTFVKSRIGCPKKAKKEIKFNYDIELKDGLIELVNWRNQIKNSTINFNYMKIPISKTILNRNDIENVSKTLESGWLVQGPKVKEFEDQWSNFTKAKYSIAVTSCTTAMYLSLVALGFKKGDEAIVPALTWVSTANVVEQLGGRVIF